MTEKPPPVPSPDKIQLIRKLRTTLRDVIRIAAIILQKENGRLNPEKKAEVERMQSLTINLSSEEAVSNFRSTGRMTLMGTLAAKASELTALEEIAKELEIDISKKPLLAETQAPLPPDAEALRQALIEKCSALITETEILLNGKMQVAIILNPQNDDLTRIFTELDSLKTQLTGTQSLLTLRKSMGETGLEHLNSGLDAANRALNHYKEAISKFLN
jgi:hypothetical protein